jgi:mismatch-specific thymine-DNA glycosylase
MEGLMATEEIWVDGKRVVTLKELLQPGLKAVFVGLNPSTISVDKEHYYQGPLGRRFWDRLRESGIAPALPMGTEDDVSFKKYGFGFADLIRRPTDSADELPKEEKAAAVPGLRDRLAKLGNRPVIVFVFAEACKFACRPLLEAGYKVDKMPAPFAARELVWCEMRRLKRVLGTNSLSRRAS